MELSLSTYDSGDHTVLEVGGEVDVYTAPRLREKLVELVEQGARHVVVDLSRVEFLDSTGLGVLVGALKRLRAVNGTFGLVCAHERLLKIFRITALVGDRAANGAMTPRSSDADDAVVLLTDPARPLTPPPDLLAEEAVAARMGLALLAGLVDDLNVSELSDGVGTEVRMSWPLERQTD